MGYENAPQTEMVATHCAACGRPLVDAVSVEVGMGPDCRKRLMQDVEVPSEAHREANKLVYQIAVIQKGIDIIEPVSRLRELGFVKLADRIEKRCKNRMKPQVIIWEEDGELFVEAPYNYDANLVWRGIDGRDFRYVKDEKGSRRANVVPVSQKRAVWDLLLKYYNGQIGTGPKGLFIVKKGG